MREAISLMREAIRTRTRERPDEGGNQTQSGAIAIRRHRHQALLTCPSLKAMLD
jgi:hypothetical protein